MLCTLPSVLHRGRDSRFFFAKGEGVPSDLHTAEGFAQGAGRQFHLQRARGFLSDLHTAEGFAQGAGRQFHLPRVRGFQVICTLPRVLHSVRDGRFLFAKGEGLPSDLHIAQRFAQGAGRQFHFRRARGFQVICTSLRVLHRGRDCSFICKGGGASK